MNELKVNGTQIFMGIEIPVIEGGFGENCRVMTAKTIAEIHGIKLKHVNEVINNNISRFKENIDIIDLLPYEIFKVVVNDLGLKGSNRTKNAYLLSERGYAKLIKIMDNDKAWEVHDELMDQYFNMREKLSSTKQKKAMLLLEIYDGGQGAIVASKQLSEIEVAEATEPLVHKIEEDKPKVEYHDQVLNKDDLITTTEIAKDLGFRSATKLNNIMFQNKIIFKNKSGVWCPYAEYEWLITEGYADYQSYITQNSKLCLKWTEKGRKWIVENHKRWVDNLEESY